MAYRVAPATPDRWADVRTAFGVRAGKPDSCWCQRFRRHQEASNEEALRREIHTVGSPIGLLAYDGELAVGWSRVVPRSTLPGIVENRALARLLDDDDRAWWVSCFAVRREYRSRGVGAALLTGAIAWAELHGASTLDGHPVDTDATTSPTSPSAVFTGTLRMFRSAGFHEIGRTVPTRPVMRIETAQHSRSQE